MVRKVIKLDTDIQYLKGVGPKMAEKLHKLGIEKISDLIFHFPRIYKDYTQITKIRDIQISENQSIKVRIVGIENKRTSRRRFTVTEAVVADETGSLQVVWFNQPYLKKMLKPGVELLLNGEVKYNRFSNSYVMESPDRAKKPSIVPVYPETKGVSSYYIVKLVSKIKDQISKIEEYLPKNILDDYDLMTYCSAIWQMHEPKDSQTLTKAKERLAFDELFFVALRARINKEALKNEQAPVLAVTEGEMKVFVESLPFELTDDQKKAAWTVALDLKGHEKNPKPKKLMPSTCIPMNRLLNGDVGSGKTVVAAFAIYIAYKAGYKSILMAPTQILANQHFETLKEILEPFGMKIALATADSKKNNQFSISNCNLIVGTQAILYLKEKMEDAGLVIVDEQHRFGVNQRLKIKKLAKNDNKAPHFLSMTATPIPRSLYLSLFSDLNISRICQMPKGRKKIKTKFVEEKDREKAYDFIRKQIEAGRQAFVICSLIEEGNGEKKDKDNLFDVDQKSVIAEYEKLNKNVFPDKKIGMLHGRLKAKEKESIMGKFASGKLDILVSTSVVEVGVDVQNSTIMMIEDAERFGLAQLHQFRGRVGRGKYQSYCFVFSSTKNQKAIIRLKSFENILDGFKLSEIDLKNRGAGQIYGKIQSGHFDFIHADLGDRMLVRKATEAAENIVGNLRDYPKINRKLSEVESTRHME